MDTRVISRLRRLVVGNALCLFRQPQLFSKKLYDHYLLRRILRRRKDSHVRVNGISLIIPNEIIPFIVIEELFIDRPYAQLHGLERVLDLGGYLGESARALRAQNASVVVFESDPDNFSYLERNVAGVKGITAYNAAVVGNARTKQVSYYKTDAHDYGGNLHKLFDKRLRVTVPAMPIRDALRAAGRCDGLKMDIEGSEYAIIEHFLKNPRAFTFKRGYIEFHFQGKNARSLRTFRNFIGFLRAGHTISIARDARACTSEAMIAAHDRLRPGEWLIFHLYFERR